VNEVRRLICLILAAALWFPSLHACFEEDPALVREGLARARLCRWRYGADSSALRRANPEWDLMERLFTVLAFANLSLREEPTEYLPVIDSIIDDTLARERAYGPRHFLLGYANRAPFLDPTGRSMFVEGEIAMMLAARATVRRDLAHEAELRVRMERIAGQIERGPALLAESYPDEVWLFCNTVALAALRLGDRVLGTNHDDLIARWLESAKAHLVHPTTGLLISETTYDGRVQDGPEGSTIWLVADMLLVIDPDFADDQYTRAKRELAGGALGFAWAREWPASWEGPEDVDSGPTIPLLEANAGASGLAIVGASAFHDDEFRDGLITSLGIGAFPVSNWDGELRFAAGNDLADAVILYALSHGPLWGTP
jgi:hypothetical protein